FLVGEMNVVFNAAGNPEMMRRTYDFHESNGWATTMWCYKALSKAGGLGDANWGMVTNRDPFGPINFAKAPEEEIEKFFKSQATMPYTVFEGLRNALAPEHVDLPEITVPPARTTAPQDQMPAWENTDVGGGLKGGLELMGDSFNLYGGGADI